MTNLPPDYKSREILESYNARDNRRMCQEHGKELALRCITDEKEICVGCIMNAHSGHQVEGIHKREQKRLNDYWKSQNTELEVSVSLQ